MRHAVLLLAAAILTFATAAQAENASSAPNKDMPNLTPTPAAAPAAPKTFSDADKAAIEDIVKTYLTKEHPEVLMEAMQELQKRDQASAEAKSEAAIKSSSDKIFNNPDSPVGGNAKGDVTVVEFFDYQCSYCKMSEPEVEKLLKEDKNVKLIYKDFPILGPMSVQAAKASLASARQGAPKYIKFHDALMNKKDHVNDEMLYQTAKDAGLDVEKLKKDMNDDAIAKQVQANIELGGEIGVRGTPMFIVGEAIYPGALQYDQLKKAVDDARAAPKKN
jgi:protein-disulfide isomerase